MGVVVGDPATDREGAISRLVIERFFHELGELSHGIEVRLWNGDRIRPTSTCSIRTRLRLRHPGALRAMLWPPSAQTLGEAYISDDFDVEGAIEPILPLVDQMLASASGQVAVGRARLGRRLLALPDVSNARRTCQRELAFALEDRTSLRAGRNALLYRPNLGNAFYACWLGPDMSFYPAVSTFDQPAPAADLDGAEWLGRGSTLDQCDAQLNLRPGETLLDLSAGWGSLVIQAARRRDIRVAGICQSLKQLELAEQRMRLAGLGDQCRLRLDWIDDNVEPGWSRNHFDKIVELGLGGHVDANQLSDHFKQVRAMLRPGGHYVYQGLTRQMGGTWGGVSPFVDSFVLPIGELVPLSTLLESAEQSRLEVQEVENLQASYLEAVRSWLRRLEERHREVECLAGERSYRAWRLYLAAMAYGLANRQLNVYEAVLHRPEATAEGESAAWES